MDIKILFNNESPEERFLGGWGFSCLIDNRILFDTGEKEESLFNNMQNMGVKALDIEAVIISHNHWDHTGGLWGLLREKKGLKVYGCLGFGPEFRDTVAKLGGDFVATERFMKIRDDIFVTGEILGTYKGLNMPEQTIVIKTEKGITVITGCSHPGIIKILESVKEKFPQEEIYFVFGGFHLMEKSSDEIENIIKRFKDIGVKKVGPTHCTGRSAVNLFRKEYGSECVEIEIGQMIKV